MLEPAGRHDDDRPLQMAIGAGPLFWRRQLVGLIEKFEGFDHQVARCGATDLLDKRSGRTSYAVLSIGGFLGINRSFYPLPFELLAYDAVEDGYVVTTDRRVLEGGPSWANNQPEFNQAYADRVAG